MERPRWWQTDPHEIANVLGIEGIRAILEAVKALKMPIDGHAPLLSGNELNAHVLSGVGSDHECVSYEEVNEKLRLGMRVMVREGSVAKNLKNIAPKLKSADVRNCMLVTDGDRTPLEGDWRWNSSVQWT
ncbi:Adenine deaminase [ANME-1 cluster archaeon GoMg1]|nr:Adenine deaminase [ANME-1 cluster archaeon GoMg1]